LLVFGGFGCFCLVFVVVCGGALGASPTISFDFHQIWWFLLVLAVFAYWFSLLLVGPSGAHPTISIDFYQICSFLVVLAGFA
jgi:hypothetical protein